MPEEEVISPRVVTPYQKKPNAPSANPDMFTDLAGFLVEDPSDYEAQFFGQPSVDQNDDTEDLISSGTS
ncbi:unnamed protein product [Dibothriocephalus latus]|uniref:Uncharacterized protein n=1 Tax=Dibothriocephalus latus TaxID=60516 RepID=A0A3P7LHG3_DIBLA|nr:unnamed protein product [Dibothriocephalus latus]